MRIVDVQTVLVQAPHPADYWGREAWKGDYGETVRGSSADLSRGYPLRWRMRHQWSPTINTVLVRVLTDDGVIGYGESKGVVSGHAIKSHIDSCLREAALGQDPFHTRMLWDRYTALMRGRGHVQGFHQEAAAGLDIACWDIVAKTAGRPLCDVLGGRYHAELPVYYSGFAGLRDADDGEQVERLQAVARSAVEQGYTAGKIAIGHGKAADLRSVDVVREAVGKDFLILVDALAAYTYADALWVGHALAERGVGWFEAPLVPEDIDGLVMLSQQLPLPVANDLLWTAAMVKEIVKRGGQVIVQPEVIKVGITECRRIAELADIYNLPYAPHSSIGSAIEYAATYHVGVAAPNLVISEHWAGTNPLGNPILTQPMEIVDGNLVGPKGAGLGVELDLDRLAPYITEGSWDV